MNSFEHHLDFVGWVEKNTRKGMDGKGNPADYVPEVLLKEYWSHETLDDVLKTYPSPIIVSIDDIRQRFLRIFSILWYISGTNDSKIVYIKKFTERNLDDSNLPLLPESGIPEVFDSSPDGRRTFRNFTDRQWLFVPVQLGPHKMQKKVLDVHAVLPVSDEGTLPQRGASSATIRKVTVHATGKLQGPRVCWATERSRSDSADLSSRTQSS
jgi:hypothetical protein